VLFRSLLAGRDAFVFEILARREDFPTTFRPDISRATVHLIPKGQYSGYYLLDTGFAGSIARGLGIENFGLASATRPMANKRQMFPKLTGSRSLALRIESTPKYWTTAQYEGEQIIQNFSTEKEFAQAAGVTIQVYTNSARKFVNRPKPIPSGRWQNADMWL